MTIADKDDARTTRRLRRTLDRGALAIAIVGLSNAILVFWFLASTTAYGTTMIVVARQKALALELYELTELEAGRAESVDASRQRALIKLENDMTLLKRGGVDDGVDIPPAPKAVAREMAQLESDWRALDRELRGARNLERVQERTERLAADADAVIVALRTRGRVFRGALAGLAGLTSLFFVAFSLMGVRFVRSAIVNPSSALQAWVRRVLARQTPPPLDLPADHALGEAVEAVTDLTTRLEVVRTERDVAQSDYQAIFDNSLAGIYQIESDGRLFLANAALAEMLGYDSADELKRSIVDARRELFVDPEHLDPVERTGTKPPRIQETKMRRKDGSEVWVLESSIRTPRPESIVYQGVVFDITPRRRAFVALRRLTGHLMEIQDEERRRLARELHDSMGQLLAAMKMNLTRLADTTELPPESSELLQDSLELGEEASRQTRTMSHLLHPPLLEELGLEHAIRDFATGFEKRSGIHIDVDVRAPDRLKASVETALFRFVQECLTNIHRHSGSESARIGLTRRDGSLVIRCEDRGRGMPEDTWNEDGELESVGVGLRGIQARIEQLGGELEIESSPKGTTVTAIVPVDSSTTDAA